MRVFELLVKHRIIVYVIGTAWKMPLTLSQKWLTIFCKRVQNINSYQIMYGDTLDFQCQRQ